MLRILKKPMPHAADLKRFLEVLGEMEIMIIIIVINMQLRDTNRELSGTTHATTNGSLLK